MRKSQQTQTKEDILSVHKLKYTAENRRGQEQQKRKTTTTTTKTTTTTNKKDLTFLDRHKRTMALLPEKSVGLFSRSSPLSFVRSTFVEHQSHQGSKWMFLTVMKDHLGISHEIFFWHHSFFLSLNLMRSERDDENIESQKTDSMTYHYHCHCHRHHHYRPPPSIRSYVEYQQEGNNPLHYTVPTTQNQEKAETKDVVSLVDYLTKYDVQTPSSPYLCMSHQACQ